MRQRGWPVVLLAFGTLMAFLVVSGAALYRYVGGVQDQIQQTQADYTERDRALDTLRFETLSLAIELRDYLLDPSPESGLLMQANLLRLRDSIRRAMARVEEMMGREDPAKVRHLRKSFDDFWESVDVVLRWTPEEKRAGGVAFLRKRVLPSREALITVAAEIAELNASLLTRRQATIRQALNDVRSRLLVAIPVAAVIGLVIALMATIRMRLLENRTELHRRQTEASADELRRLSQRVVKAQEDERRSVSRELHDEIGQMLTALKMELGNLEDALNSHDQAALPHAQAANGLAEQTMQAVRQMARGLRPAMLDDLGLSSALKWHARDFSRHSGIAVNFQVDGDVDSIPDSHRTCTYRVVQEALTNCARHAQAKEVRIALHGSHERLSLTVQDDGVGFDPRPPFRKGVGLVSIEERVRELGGNVTIVSQPRKGTLLKAEIPLPPEPAP
jgi:signal transduction histidine kinase